MSRDQTTIDRVVPQNIYDDEAFFQGYKSLRQNDTGLNNALEIPALRQLLPALAGLRILDLGCGFGDFARFARAQGAASVTAIDVSARMLEEATVLTRDKAVTYTQSSIEEYVPPENAFDLVVSSLALHYVEDYAGVVSRVHRALKPSGHFVCSIEHPICTANPIGWVRDQNDQPTHWPLDLYAQEGKRITHWFVDGVVKYHRTTETYVNTLVQVGFLVTHLGEPTPTREAVSARPSLQLECRRPPFLLLAAIRPATEQGVR